MTSARNSEISKSKILKEAEIEFAHKGPIASSVNVIADKAQINKRMIYHYFGSKEELYKEVLKTNFYKIRAIGDRAFVNANDSISCVKQIIRDYYYFLKKNPNYVKIMAWEEISGGYIARDIIPNMLLLSYDRLKEVYQDGVNKKIFKEGIDLTQLVISVTALCFLTFARREILESYWKDDMDNKLEDRLRHIYDLVLNTLCI